MLKKYIPVVALLVCTALLASCEQVVDYTSIVTGSDNKVLFQSTDCDNSDTAYNLVGKFWCDSGYFRDEYFVLNQGSIPYIFFEEDGYCVMGINYLEGGCDIPGKYVITDDEIEVKLDFSDSVLENTVADDSNSSFITDVYKFLIIDENTISICGMCFTVMPSDVFVRDKY